MKTLLLLFALSAPVAAAQSATAPTVPTDPTVQHAAEAVAKLHDGMLDPPTFVLDQAFTTKPDKKGRISYCYAYRSHNTMGGYSAGRSLEWGLDPGKVSDYHSDANGKFPGYDSGWIAPCGAKHLDKDITADAAALAATLYKKAK